MYCDGKKKAPNGQARKYQSQYDNAKHCAKQRNIDWQFTYDEWIAWWGNDIINRGPRKGQLVMARNKDTGPYHPTNVRKATCSENCSEGNIGKVDTQTRVEKYRLSRARNKAMKKELELI
jgi:hypothetical protein